MTDIEKIQHKVNTDQIARKEFLKNPGAYLKKNGITLSADQLAAIETQILNKADPFNLCVD